MELRSVLFSKKQRLKDEGGERELVSAKILKEMPIDQNESINEFLSYLQSKGRLHLAEAGKNLRVYHLSSYQGNKIKVILVGECVLAPFLED